MLFCDEDKNGYTIELGKIERTEGMKVFDFPYKFYDEEFKCDFERKFIDHYYFDEIGFETIGRFKHHLKSRLNLRMPYYEQLYKTELAAEGIDFLLNKDLKEVTIRELATEDKLSGTNTVTSLDNRSIAGTDITDTNGTNETDHIKGSKTQFTTNDKTTNKLLDSRGGVNIATTIEDNATTDKSSDVIKKEVTTGTTIDQTVTTQGDSTDNEKVSNINDGVASPSLSQQYLTGVGEKTNRSNGTERTEAHNSERVDDGSTENIQKEGTEKKNVTNKEVLGETLEKTGTVEYEKKDISMTSGTDKDNTTIKNRDIAIKEQTIKDEGSSVGANKEDRNGKEQEKIEFTSKGNIGVVSPADLLEKWRNIIINLDEMIILDCRDLFMGIF